MITSAGAASSIGLVIFACMQTPEQAKITRKPFLNVTRSTNLLDLIHSNTYDFKSFVTRCNMKYFITFNDDYSRFCCVYLLKSKNKAYSKFVEFQTWVEKQLRHPIQKLKSERWRVPVEGNWSIPQEAWYHCGDDRSLLPTVQWNWIKKESHTHWDGKLNVDYIQST